ncbi:MAG: hypothetical protein WCW17_00465 [Patescibacteria group bacterium]|jgi:hypothetical protein
MKKNWSVNKSFVLPLVILFTAALSLIGFYLVNTINQEFKLSKNTSSATKCFYLAEAGANEAIWMIKNDETAKATFLNSTDGQTTFTRNTNLTANGSYSVVIQNSAKGVATITSNGTFEFGPNKTSNRKIKIQVAKAIDPPPYNKDGAIYTGGGQASSEQDINIWGSILNIHNSSIISNRDISIKFLSDVNIDKDIKAVRNIDIGPLSSLSYGGVRETGMASNAMPTLDFNSVDVNSYKNLAQSQNQLYTQQAFKNLLKSGNQTLSGVVYVTGGIDVDLAKTLTINGMLIAEGNINIGTPTILGTVNINHVDGKPSGIASMSKITIDRFGSANITGLVYAGSRVDISTGFPMTITGGILSRDFYLNYRQLDIYFDANLINEALSPSTNDTPVIILNHWEEEY